MEQGRERDAARDMGRSQRDLDEERARLAELTAYREEYQQRFLEAMRKGLVASGVLEYQSFLARLSEAIEQQQSRVDAGYAQFEASRRQWVQCHQRSNAVDKVVERYRDQERMAVERREQHEADERAQRNRSEG
jgi:flagellar FliJ protein